jgi:hypothetical protein
VWSGGGVVEDDLGEKAVHLLFCEMTWLICEGGGELGAGYISGRHVWVGLGWVGSGWVVLFYFCRAHLMFPSRKIVGFWNKRNKD